MKKFLKVILFFCIPFFALFAIYVYTDPFKVVRHYDLQAYIDTMSCFKVNSHLIATMKYINLRNKYHYDSFIFGNSRSMNYNIEDWLKYIPESSSCFHFNGESGSIRGWHDKICFIDNNQDTIKNALCILDHELLSRNYWKKMIHAIEPPILCNNDNWFNYQFTFFKAFCDFKFLFASADYMIFGKYRDYMKNVLLVPGRRNKDLRTNQILFRDAEEKIAAGTYYDAEHMKPFKNVQKPGTFSAHILTDEERQLIREIREVFDRHHTNYEIILGPQYDQIKLNQNTMDFLYETFGKEHVHDFTGVNKWTQDYHNYYENSHYRPCVAAEVLGIVYGNQ